MRNCDIALERWSPVVSSEVQSGTCLDRVDEIVPGRRFVLSRDLFHRKLVHLTHSFAIHELEPRATRFTQRWEATGLLVPLMWNKLASVMAKFEAFGADLKVHVEGRAHRGPES